MFEVESKKLNEFIKSRTIGLDKSIKLIQILEAPISVAIKNYFKLEAEALLSNEKYFNINKERFDITNTSVIKSLSILEDNLKNNCIFLRNEFVQLLGKAIDLELNYLTKPRRTITKFIFKNDLKKRVTEIKSLLRYFLNYSYINEILIGYFEKKNIDEVSISDFDKLLKKIDSSFIQNYSQYEIASMPKALLDFINYSNSVKSKSIDISVLLSFYDDKELLGITSALNIEKEKNKVTSLSVDDLFLIVQNTKDIYKSDYNREFILSSEKTSDEGNDTNKIKPLVFAEKETLLTSQLNEPPDEVSNTGMQSKIKNDDSKDTTTNSSNLSNNMVLMDAKKETKKIAKIISDFDYEFTVVSGVLHSNKNQYVSFYIPDEDEKVFIKKLFDKNIYEYKAAIRKLSGLKDWYEASSFIDELFIKYKIDPYSKPAINFTDKIHSGFLDNNVY
jgi:hypothetical protein